MFQALKRASIAGALCAFLVTGIAPAASRCAVAIGAPASSCRMKVLSRVEVSKDAGLGRIEVAGKIGAVLARDEGAVTMLDLSKKGKPRPLGSYDDDIPDSFDGDLAFSDDGRWLFYARQTHQFSKDGLHILDVADPENPTLRAYIPAGGAFRIGYYEDAGVGWIYMLDAIAGLVAYRFEPTTGVAVPVHLDALPALKVGGPASAGIVIDRKDPATGTPLMYVTTGRTGLHVLDISDPTSPEEVGAWSEMGLAEIEVAATKGSRTIYAAPEYWFDSNLPSQVIELDATDLAAIEEKRRFRALDTYPIDPNDSLRLQGMTLAGKVLYVAHSALGLVGFDVKNGSIVRAYKDGGKRNASADVIGEPYAIDVEVAGGLVYVTDGATGTLSVLR